MPYQIEARTRTSPREKMLGIYPKWTVLSQADWFPNLDDAEAVIRQLYKDDGPEGGLQYKATFFTLGHPDQFDDQEFGS